MDLSAIRQTAPTTSTTIPTPAQPPTRMPPPPGVEARQWCIAKGLCFYCKTPGHSLDRCTAKQDADAKREQGIIPPRNAPRFIDYSGNSNGRRYTPHTPSYNAAYNTAPPYNFGTQTNHAPFQNRALTGGGFVNECSVVLNTPS